jgi:16S rRNA (guanine527-N7)-methyltransferase
MDDIALLHQGLQQLGLSIDHEQEQQFVTYISEVNLFNRTYRLVNATGREFVIRHLLDSLAAVPYFHSIVTTHTHLCDVGSGAGLPGIPLAIMLKGTPIFLVERMGRRAGFLENALARCNLSDRVTVIQRDLSEVKQQFDIVTCRAFHPLGDVIREIAAIVTDDGVFCAYKGKEEVVQQELYDLEALVQAGKGGSVFGWESHIIALSVPYLDATRNLCVLKKRLE